MYRAKSATDLDQLGSSSHHSSSDARRSANRPSLRPSDRTATANARAAAAAAINGLDALSLSALPQQQQQQHAIKKSSSHNSASKRSNSNSRPRSPVGSTESGNSGGTPRLGRSLEEGDLPSPSMTSTVWDLTMVPPQSSNLTRWVSEPVSSSLTAPATQLSTSEYRHVSPRVRKMKLQQQQAMRIFDDPIVTAGYASVPQLEQVDLSRGGVSVETAAVGRVQFGIPPETIKDSMLLGLEVPRIYIVPREQFCSDWGPALGINLAEFEFPAYFNWFVRQKKCCLVVDSLEAELNIRTVFEETLLGPKKFRDPDAPLANDDEDFDPDFPLDMRPNFYKEFQHFRAAEKTSDFAELNTDMLLDFCHFVKGNSSANLPSLPYSTANERIGVPPIPSNLEEDEDEDEFTGNSLDFAEGDVIFECTRTDRLIDHHRSIADLYQVSSRDAEPSQRKARFAELPIDHGNKASRRASLESVESIFSVASGNTLESMKSDATYNQQTWMFSQIQWLGEVATVWPADATPEQIRKRNVPRVEIFKMPGNGTEYVIHDVDASNCIVGKIRLRGAVRVPDKISVEGFLSETALELGVDRSIAEIDDECSMADSTTGGHDPSTTAVPRPLPKALFHPPSFGVTVLGNSHGFDKNGSTSGYVLWVNGRGIMIDPPPYSSATLEREGIRPQMIFGVMITHCHADHDAGAFQKVLTGSRLSVITTPSIYKSFIRKYSALSGLSPTLLQHSHRYRSAIIGEPLKFQGATFHFTYTLHTIPCISFKVEWRGRSIVFTGDHLNLPSLMDELEEKGVLSKGRADCLRQMPLQDCDVLLHEAGAPPIHTPLTVLQSLPDNIRSRLYVVHTSALPPDSGLRVAPTGTSGTIRLDDTTTSQEVIDCVGNESGQYENGVSSRGAISRPACISDAWFVLNLISNIPFFSSLSYVYTMEVLEIASVYEISCGDIVVPARKRQNTLCVVWEGTCIECDGKEVAGVSPSAAVWHAGDWTSPVILQPNNAQAAKVSDDQEPKDMIALSEQGVKVIIISMHELNKVLMRGSKLYRKYVGIEDKHGQVAQDDNVIGSIHKRVEKPASRHVVDVIKINSLLGNLYAGQVRALEAIAEGPRLFEPGSYLWKSGSGCDFAYLIATGSAHYVGVSGRRRSIGMNTYGSSRNVLETVYGKTIEIDKMLHDLPPESEFARLDLLMALRDERMCDDPDYRTPDRPEKKLSLAQSDRNANKAFARLYASRKAIDGLVVSRGCFVCDTAKMVAGELVNETDGTTTQHLHSTSLMIGQAGCTAWVFPQATLMPFLEANPGILLSLLGTQVVV